jgi:hypothetical protein
MSRQSRTTTNSASQAGPLEEDHETHRGPAARSSTAPAQSDREKLRRDDDAASDPGHQRRVESEVKGISRERGAEAAGPDLNSNRPAQQHFGAADQAMRSSAADDDLLRKDGTIREKPDKAIAGNMSSSQRHRQPDTTRQGPTTMQ